MFRSEIERIKNFEEKIERKTFLKCIWLDGRGRKINGGPRCFLPGPTKKFSPQNGEKAKGRK